VLALSLPDTVEAPTPYGWDWSSTTHDGRDDDEVRGIVRQAVRALGGFHTLPGKGLQGWTRSLESFDCDGFRLGSVYFGGRTDVHVVSTSAAADAVRSDVLSAVPGKTARVDTRVDSLVPFGDLAGILEAAADSYGSLITRVESSQRGESKGRTVYLGAPSSAIRVRLYEKWLESPGQYVEGTNRVEVQLRPPSKTKDRVSGWSRAETFCASRVTQDLAERLGADLAPVASLHVKRGTPDLERSLAAMSEQYGRAADRFLRISGGDVDRLLGHLLAKVGTTA
jgi:hypothetical protein